MTNEELKTLARELRQEALDDFRTRRGPVASAMENPLTWIGFLSVFLTFIGVLMYNIYQNDSDSLSGKIKSNTTAIEAIQAVQRETATLVLKMQGNQETISKQIERNADKLDKISEEYDGMLNTRFTNTDGERLYTEIQDYTRKTAESILRDFTEMKTDFKALETKVDDLRFLEGRVNQVSDNLKELKTKADDTESRLRSLESRN